MRAGFAKFLMKVTGWKYATPEDGIITEKKVIYLAAPHTSFYDFFVGYLYASSLGVKFKVMVKKELFFFPMGPILRALGAFPIDRKHPEQVLMNIMHEMNNSESFYLCICPEGTRKPVKKWKTGYHAIATHTGVPVYGGFYDYKKKVFGHGKCFELTSDARSDTEMIQAYYRDLNLRAFYPKKFIA